MANAKVVLNNEVLMDITDTTATASDVAEGKILYTADGLRTVGTGAIGGGVPSGGAAGEILTKVSSTDYDVSWQSAPVISVNGKTGAITLSAPDVGALPSSTAIPSSAADVGAIPAPASASSDNVLAYNGTAWVADKRTVILSYGSSTWAEFISAYKSNAVMYCRASSNANPGTGTQGRLAFMAYVDNSDNPTNVEFQYYRSVSSHSYAQQGDQVFIYKLTSAGSWTVTVREAYTKIVPSTGLSSSYSNGVLTLTNAAALPTGGTTGQMLVKTSNTNYAAAWGSVYDIPAGGSTGQVLTKSSDSDYAVTWTSVSQVPAITSADNGKFLRVVDGVWAAQSVNYANGVIF